MAEYYISYEEIETIVCQYINETTDNIKLGEYKAEILTALTGDFEEKNLESIKELILLWKNQFKIPSQMLHGSRYIQVQHIMLDFLKVAFTSGLIDALIVYCSQSNFSGFTLSVGSSIAIALWELLTSVKELNDWDFCIYMQAVTHFRKHKEFTLEELKDWLLNGKNLYCNMHNDTWDCDYLNDDDTCGIGEEQQIEKSLKSLYDKGLLLFDKKDHKYTYKFKS